MTEENDGDGTNYSVPPVHRAFTLLRHIAAGGRCNNASATSRALGINRTTLIRLLHTLEAERMIESMDDGLSWQLGPGMIALAADALKSRDVLKVARPVMSRLVAQLELSSHLGILDGTEVIYLLRETPNSHLISNVREGSRLPAHATTIGRVLLGWLPEGDIERLYVGDALKTFTEKTASSLEALTAQITADRARGVAWSSGNFERGIGSCAAPVFDHQGRTVASINVTGPETQFTPDTPLALRIEEAVKAAAAEISAALGFTEQP
ncbi:IclR family transcriptional regulator [Pararhodobacter zhoushanensis]|uniref:IclR family transcriptional regulator n=1 Tax=Pararhodobacter zhoushanensis TaxID=2479545 RepID=A0ABT3GUF1_9RHOB|nr:IclR family transcriptional regulator [Pararhodobacter zhoushanensis]MCW1931165.1 IclR family transcriptional regulator [Pararhodobacter zhoushanensis]